MSERIEKALEILGPEGGGSCSFSGEELDFVVITLREAQAALADAVWAADFLAEQQAMPDDGYKERLERARAALAVSPPADEAKPQPSRLVTETMSGYTDPETGERRSFKPPADEATPVAEAQAVFDRMRADESLIDPDLPEGAEEL